MKVTEFVSACRKRSGKTQQAFADALGVRRETVAAWEGGVQPPAFTNLEQMAKVAGVNIDDCLSLPEHREHAEDNEAALSVLRTALKQDATRDVVLDLVDFVKKFAKRVRQKPPRKQI